MKKIKKILFLFSFLDVATEKTQQNLISGIEHFDATKLKHAQTQEKNPLPDLDGKCEVGNVIQVVNSGVEFRIYYFCPLCSNRTREGKIEFHQWH